jgi:hypothetical protein
MTAFAALLVLLGSSCVSLLELDGYKAAVSGLCTQFNQCFENSYSNCVDKASARLSSAPTQLRAQWLVDFNDDKCVTLCSTAYNCMDSNPICGDLGTSCKVAEECCTFTDSVADCVAGSCCILDGRTCAADDDCCAGACINNLCGGIECSNNSESCMSDDDCCTELICNRDLEQCVKCNPDGFECTSNDQCCGECVNNLCQSPCTRDGNPCGSNGDCCNGVCGVATFEDGDQSLCAGCDNGLPNTSLCFDNAECCSGLCDPHAGSTCQDCRKLGEDCVDTVQCCDSACTAGTCGDCSAGGSACSDPSACCSGICSAYDTMGLQACCNVLKDADNPCSHTVCQLGDWLDVSCPVANDPNGDPTDTCIADICGKDPFCCCGGWDQLCVDAVPSNCNGITCLNGQMMVGGMTGMPGG